MRCTCNRTSRDLNFRPPPSFPWVQNLDKNQNLDKKPKSWQTNQFLPCAKDFCRILPKEILPKNTPKKNPPKNFLPKNSTKTIPSKKKSSKKNPPKKFLLEKIHQKSSVEKKSSRKIPQKFRIKSKKIPKNSPTQIITIIALKGRNPFRAC